MIGATTWLCWAAQAAAAELPQWDLSNGIPITQQIRQQQIEAELAELGDDHPWAGRYTYGDGLGVNQSLLIAPKGGFVVTWHGCLGLYGTNEGQVSETADGHLLLHFLWANRPGGSGGFPGELVLVPWGERMFLIPPAELIQFVSTVHQLGLRAANGLYFKRRKPEGKVSGRPQLPDSVASQLRAEALALTVSAVGPVTTRQLDWGACLLQRELWFDSAQAASLADGLELRPEDEEHRYDEILLSPADRRGRIGRWSVSVKPDCQIEPARLPEAGWVYSTGAFDPDAPEIPRAACDD